MLAVLKQLKFYRPHAFTCCGVSHIWNLQPDVSVDLGTCEFRIYIVYVMTYPLDGYQLILAHNSRHCIPYPDSMGLKPDSGCPISG